MFETAEIGEKLDKDAFHLRLPEFREAMLDAEFQLREEKRFSVVFVVAGAEGAGKGETVNCLLEWLDPRGVETHAMSKPTDEERDRPPYYQFWRRLPPKGKIGIFFGSWYTAPIVQHIARKTDDDRFDREMRRIVDFERMLANEGVLIVKVWLHITRKQQKQRLRKLERNPETSWRVTKQDWHYYKTYDDFIRVAAKAVCQTSSGHAPWQVVEAADNYYRNLAVGEHLLSSLKRRLDVAETKPAPVPTLLPPQSENLISTMQLEQPLSRKDYRAELSKWQGKLSKLARRMASNDQSTILVFEGNDGAGKGGCIRRVAQALDARFYQVIPVAAPTDEEKAHPYLWRFWRTLPGKGHIQIYDRSWYGRVLVERIEGLCERPDWQRAYSEINDFERELTENQMLVIKFWLAISSEEQLARFRHREETGYKRYKLTEEDWRNREKAPAYESAACDMIEHTSTPYAPWTKVEANNKLFARVKVLRTICKRLEKAME
ncbi:MAG: polyphosphate:AMP phosphotransferase [Planctomycetales bacterium]|nr:polyphosphate:AMP phosphotransferase [Planctomycetales bacterium]